MQNSFFLTSLKKQFCLAGMLALVSACASAPPKVETAPMPSDPYCGCLMFSDDVRRAEEFPLLDNVYPRVLFRSWFERSLTSINHERGVLDSNIEEQGKKVGGGISLSLVTDDLPFLTIDLEGNPVRRNGFFLGSLGAPEYRTALIKKLMAQVSAGVTELYLGEPSGSAFYDDWTLGRLGEIGFTQWLKAKYAKKDSNWYYQRFGDLGINAKRSLPVSRSMILKMTPNQRKNFDLEFGEEGSFSGRNTQGKEAFLSHYYAASLSLLLSELKAALEERGKKNINIDIMGFAHWMKRLSPQPDGFVVEVPDSRFGFPWEISANYDLPKNRAALKQFLVQQIQNAKPAKVVFSIESRETFRNLQGLPEARAIELLHFWTALTEEVHANFIIPSIDRIESFGATAKPFFAEVCRARQKKAFCSQ